MAESIFLSHGWMTISRGCGAVTEATWLSGIWEP